MYLALKLLRWSFRALALVLSLGSAWGAWVVADAALAACQGAACADALLLEAPRVLLLALAGLAGTAGVVLRHRRLLRASALLFPAAWLAKHLAEAWLHALRVDASGILQPILAALSDLAIPVGVVTLLLFAASCTYREDARRAWPSLKGLRARLDALAEGPA